MTPVAKVWTIVRKDLALELRSREMLSPMLAFALMVLFVFNFAFELRVDNVQQIAPGVLWVTFVFAGILGLGRSFIQERDQGCLDGLLLCPVDRGIIYLAKVLGNLVFTGLIEALSLPLYFVLFDVPFRPLILPVVFMGTLGFSAVGTLFSAMTVHTRAREVLLPILLFPVAIPALVAAVKLTGGLMDGQPWVELRRWFQLLGILDVVFLVASYVAFDYVVEE